MAKLRLSSYKAEPQKGGTIAIIFDFSDPVPTKTVDIRTAADAEAALNAYADEAKATGQPLNVSMSLCRGERAPNGFKKLKSNLFVNC